MKGFEQISDEILNKIYELTVFNGIIIIIFLFCLMKMEYSVSVKVAGTRNIAAEICSARAGLYKS